MAHQLASNPLIIDSSANNNNLSIRAEKTKVTQLEWIEPANANDEVILLSSDDNNCLIWAAVASGTTNVQSGHDLGWVEGLYLRKLDSGKLAIFFE